MRITERDFAWKVGGTIIETVILVLLLWKVVTL